MRRLTRLVHDAVADWRARTPAAEAVRAGAASWSYAELDARVNRFARYLGKCGVRAGAVVAVVLDPSIELIVAALGTMRAGAVYLPLEPGYPLERRRRTIADAGAAVAVMAGAQAWDFRDDSVRTLCPEAERAWIAHEPDTPPEVAVTGGDLAYLIYTSGSTGEPKGVMVAHAALAAKLGQPGAWGQVSARTRCALLGSIAFDASLAQMLLPLVHGGTTVLLDIEERLTPARLWPALKAGGVTLVDCTPSWLSTMLDAAPADVGVQRLVLGGEALPPSLAHRIARLWPDCRIVNAYGPTEACIDAAAHEIDVAEDVADTIPIGRPLPGYVLSVRDPAGAILDAGVKGELWIGGVGLARGYWRRPEETALRFVGAGTDRRYRTGDLAVERAGGAYEFCGRIDDQVKIRGQRVELDEIARVIERDPAVAAAAVVLRGEPPHDGRLVAYMVPRSGTVRARALGRLRDLVAETLPAHMVPCRWLWIERLPLTATGKLDKAALPAPPDQAPSGTAPRDAVERFLCALWAETLGLDGVGIEENFFELGGHSLLCALVIDRINREHALELPLIAMFASPTVADMALTIARRAHIGGTSRLIRLNGARDGPALFCVPPLSGVGTVYAGLGRRLATPIHALQATHLPQRPPGTTSMAELADTFVADMRAVQPRGPYHLCGYSAGGAIAVAMCEALRNSGDEAAALLLIDPYCDEPDDTDSDADATRPDEEGFWLACRELLGDMGIMGSAADPTIKIAERLWRDHLSHAEGSQPDDALREQARQALGATLGVDVFMMMLEGTRNIWGAYTGHALPPMRVPPARCRIVQPDGDAAPFRAARLARWRALVGDRLEQRLVPGEHATMLARGRTVDAIAGIAREMLAEPVRADG